MRVSNQQANAIYYLGIFLCFMPFMSPAMALVSGLFLSLIGIKNPTISGKMSLLLQISIVTMGFGMDLTQVIETSKTGMGLTAMSVVFTILVGILLGKLLKIEKSVYLLIAAGTAICGGSAIAAVAPVIKAKNHQILFSMGVIFVLNAVALFIFPVLGHYFNLSQETFGTWAAIAIHDTSSVVGAGAAYGEKALEVATTVKLTRALWIIPLCAAFSYFYGTSECGKKKMPWFIAFYVIAILIAYFLPEWKSSFDHLAWFGKKGMIAALFLIGSSISIEDAKKAGLKSFLLGILLWIFIGASSLIYII
ncbi:YeiH family protein [Sediminitomix flava]|uniref:Putative integral membrane protein (TIGR00698 family) n=1 Tax=Sediminitomix flava TaxID=379075 RepID=A0A315Z9E8_SEDFL|nr:putative sulfate exporter family transporter [Sediminitomix flava]PWJ40176.1 putative integral membrane protein (TIGR00698 family) [Sediminitomix flava]